MINVLGVNRHHHSNACVLQDGKLVFSLEEDRLSNKKYDGIATLNTSSLSLL